MNDQPAGRGKDRPQPTALGPATPRIHRVRPLDRLFEERLELLQRRVDEPAQRLLLGSPPRMRGRSKLATLPEHQFVFNNSQLEHAVLQETDDASDIW